MSIDRRHNGRWRARWREVENGPQKSKTFDRKLDAQRWLVKMQSSLLDGTYIAPEAGRATVGDYLTTWAAGQVWRDSTREQVASYLGRHVVPTFGDRPLASVRSSEVQAWVKRLAEQLAPLQLLDSYLLENTTTWEERKETQRRWRTRAEARTDAAYVFRPESVRQVAE